MVALLATSVVGIASIALARCMKGYMLDFFNQIVPCANQFHFYTSFQQDIVGFKFFPHRQPTQLPVSAISMPTLNMYFLFT